MRTLLFRILHHPIYSGAYAYGFRPADDGSDGSRDTDVGLSPDSVGEWEVLIPDRLPAYITWDHYLTNLRRLGQNGHWKAKAHRARARLYWAACWCAGTAAAA